MKALGAELLLDLRNRWARPLPPVTLIGNAFGDIGRSEHLRTTWRALAAASVPARILDVYDQKADHDVALEMGHCEVANPAPGIRVFHLNGNEIASALDRLEARSPGFFGDGYNIVAPVWELTRYPEHWARQLDRFDEIWVPTAFVESSVRPAVSVPVHRMRNACEPHATSAVERSYFGIASDAFVVLFMFDLRSFVARKNPSAAIDAVAHATRMRPNERLHLVLKVHHGDRDPEALAAIYQRVAAHGLNAMVIDAALTTNEAKNLIRCCDCFLSLHRSEGFGRGPAEAMFFAKPVIATGWSGNMDYMDTSRAFPIHYSLVPVAPLEYLEHEEQQWAEPDIAGAADALVRIVDDPAHARRIGERAAAHMRRWYSDTAIGSQIRSRLAVIARSLRARANHQ